MTLVGALEDVEGTFSPKSRFQSMRRRCFGIVEEAGKGEAVSNPSRNYVIRSSEHWSEKVCERLLQRPVTQSLPMT